MSRNAEKLLLSNINNCRLINELNIVVTVNVQLHFTTPEIKHKKTHSTHD